ncbi:unnamed protein product [Chrysoparadoxa australica]
MRAGKVNGEPGLSTAEAAYNSKVVNWFRLPMSEGWAPASRLGHTAVAHDFTVHVFGGIGKGRNH